MIAELATLVATAIPAALSVAAIVQPDLVLGAESTADTDALLLYLGGRNIGLAVLVAGALLAGGGAGLATLGMVSGTVQLVDLYVALQRRHTRRAALALVLALVQFGGLFAANLAIPL